MKGIKGLAQMAAAAAVRMKAQRRECEARGSHDLGDEREGPFSGYSDAPGKSFYERRCRHCGVIVLEEVEEE